MSLLTDGLDNLGIGYDDSIVAKFTRYMERVLEWNEKVNMTGITAERDFIVKHYLDSLVCYGWDELGRAEQVIDVGTGAGFPGVPLAILFPEKKFILLDSLAKRIKIIEGIAEELDIKNVEPIHGRAEDFGRDKKYRESFDLCLSRAVADLKVLAEYCLPFVKWRGYFLAYKSKDIDNELLESQSAIKVLGGKLKEVREVALDEGNLLRRVVVIEKRVATPSKYPRTAGLPERSPIV